MITQWGILSVLSILFLTARLIRRVSLSAALLGGYMVLNGALLVFFPHLFRYELTDDSILKHLHNNVLSSVFLVLCLAPLGFLPKLRAVRSMSVVTFLTSINILFVGLGGLFVGKLSGNDGFSGLGYVMSFCDYSAQNGCFIALAMPLLYLQHRRLAALGLVAMWLSGGVMPWAVLGVSSVCFWAAGRLKRMGLVCVVGLLLSPALYFVEFNYRLQLYVSFMSEWLKRGYYLLGLGPGSLQFFNRPIVQAYRPFGDDVLMYEVPWLHSDWLQLLFEHGFIGFGLGLWVFASLGVRLFSNPSLFSVLMGLSATAVFNYPMRYVYGVLLLVLLVKTDGDSNAGAQASA